MKREAFSPDAEDAVDLKGLQWIHPSFAADENLMDTYVDAIEKCDEDDATHS